MGWFFVRMAVAPVALVRVRVEQRLRVAILRMWARGVCSILGVRVTVCGPLPTAPRFVVSNHLSYLDVIVYIRLLGCVFVSMAEVDGWPLIGTLARGVNTVFINRKRRRDVVRVNAEIMRAIRRGNGIMAFPESTTTFGDTLLPFRSALLQPAVELKIPIHYAAIAYATPRDGPRAEDSVCWVDDTPFAVHALRLLRLRWVDATVTFGGAPITGTDRRQLGSSLHDAVKGLMSLEQ